MNTLKTIITATILLFAITSTQQVKGQTKEETIAWIKEKLEKYGKPEALGVSYGDCYRLSRTTFPSKWVSKSRLETAQNNNEVGEFYSYSISVSECYISISAESVINIDWFGRTDALYYKMNGLLVWHIPVKGTSISPTGFINKLPVIEVYKNIFITNPLQNSKECYQDNTQTDYIGSMKFYIQEREENLIERINKAIQHLATFCPKEQKNEAF